MFSNNVDFLFHFLNRYEYSVVNNSIVVYYLKRKATPNKDILLYNAYFNAFYTLNQIQWLETKAGIYIGIVI
jgi:lipoprotein NlpI